MTARVAMLASIAAIQRDMLGLPRREFRPRGPTPGARERRARRKAQKAARRRNRRAK